MSSLKIFCNCKMDKSSNAVIQSNVTQNLDIEHGKNKIRPLLGKSSLHYGALSARKNMEREIIYIQKKISAIHLDHKKNGLSKSARKRLRKKRQADLKLALNSGATPTTPANPAAHLDDIQKSSKKTESGAFIDCKGIKQVCGRAGSNTQIQQTALKHVHSKQGTNAKKLSMSEFSRRKTCKKSKRGKRNKLSTQNLQSSNANQGYLPEIRRCKIITKSYFNTKHREILPLYSFILRDNLKTIPTEDIFWLLEMQNHFVTNEWILMKRSKANDDSVTITVCIDPKTESLLKNKNFQASLFRTTVEFTAAKQDVINKTKNATMQAEDRRNTLCKEGYTDELHSSIQAEENAFSWLGKWQTFTTVLNKIN